MQKCILDSPRDVEPSSAVQQCRLCMPHVALIKAPATKPLARGLLSGRAESQEQLTSIRYRWWCYSAQQISFKACSVGGSTLAPAAHSQQWSTSLTERRRSDIGATKPYRVKTQRSSVLKSLLLSVVSVLFFCRRYKQQSAPRTQWRLT
jgi:hypothetical protein